MSKKFYVVWKGAETGIFDNWGKVQAVTSGRADAQFMGFTSKADAEQAFSDTYTKALMKRSMEKGGASSSSSYAYGSSSKNQTAKSKGNKAAPAQPSSSVSKADIQIYCDGACSPNPGKSGTGIAIYQQGKLHSLWYGLYNANGTNNTAELNGLLMAFKLAKQSIEKGRTVEVLTDSKYSIDSITKWAAGWQRKGWKKANGEAIKNPELIKPIYELYLQVKKSLKISHVKGHANIEGNELSDRMAVLGRMTNETAFIQYKEDKTIAEVLAMPSG